MDSSTPFASFLILGTTLSLIFPAPFQGVFQGRADLLFPLVVDAEDFLERDPDMGNVFFDVRTLLLRVRFTQPAADVEPQLPAHVLERDLYLFQDFGIGSNRLLALRRA